MEKWIENSVKDELYTAHDAIWSIKGILMAQKELHDNTEYVSYIKKAEEALQWIDEMKDKIK